MTTHIYDGEMLSEWDLFQEKDSRLKREWEYFVQNGKAMADSTVQAEILSSWIRCRDRKINPFSEEAVVLSQAETQTRIDKNSELIESVTPLLDEMAESIRASAFRMDLYDEELFLVARFGKRNKVEERVRIVLPLGVSLKETDCGTNAVSLAALLEKPVQLMSHEHYNVKFHGLTSSAVPIRGINGKIVGVISVCGFCWPQHKHTLGMLIALRKSIETILYENVDQEKINLIEGINKTAIEMLDDIFIAVDANGTVVINSKSAHRLLPSDKDSFTGYSCETLWGSRNPFLEVLHSKKAIQNRNMAFASKDNLVYLLGTVSPVFSRNGILQGACGIFKDKSLQKASQKHSLPKAYYTFENLIGESEEIRQTIRLAKETADMQSNVLIQGESGTGKELFAQAIHNASPYRRGPFVAVNCAAIPNGLLESELFGYEGGAFTGARNEGRHGKFEIATGGTIFLDEINSMPLEMQVKILRTIQNKTITRVGGSEEYLINVRIIVATNADLWEMVRSGDFREDLFYRINVITIQIPPLRERLDDIELLIDHTLKELSNKMQIELSIEERAIELMKEYKWPGNVRELENVIERGVVLARTKGRTSITMEDILDYQRFRNECGENVTKSDQQFSETKYENKKLNEIEKNEIEKLLITYGGNISKIAKELGIARNTLYRKIKKYNIE